MIRTPQELRALTSDLGTSVWVLAALGTLFESGVVDQLKEPMTVADLGTRCSSLSGGQIEHCLTVAASVGVVVADGPRYRLAEGAMPFLNPPMRAALPGDIRANIMQALALLDSARGERPSTGWRHTDPKVLQAQGDASSMLPMMMKREMIPALEGLGTRLEQPGARFLDVGVGVGALAIAMCRAFPQVGVLGLDASDVPLELARKNVSDAELTARIELRRETVETLRDETAFDLAWLPSFFIPGDVVPTAVARIHAALRPGGWLVFAVDQAGGEVRDRAVWGLINEEWGGGKIPTADAEALLRTAGFSKVRSLPGPPGAPTFVVGCR